MCGRPGDPLLSGGALTAPSGPAPGQDPQQRLRALCLCLPGATERESHGEPAWFAGDKKLFVTYSDHHHDDRVAFWCACETAERDALVASHPDRYFVPPYVGYRGWLGAWVDVPADWEEIAELVTEAFRLVAPRRLVAELEGRTRVE